jgi:hypothetical protein
MARSVCVRVIRSGYLESTTTRFAHVSSDSFLVNGLFETLLSRHWMLETPTRLLVLREKRVQVIGAVASRV